jgi:hypothetical protein
VRSGRSWPTTDGASTTALDRDVCHGRSRRSRAGVEPQVAPSPQSERGLMFGESNKQRVEIARPAQEAALRSSNPARITSGAADSVLGRRLGPQPRS